MGGDEKPISPLQDITGTLQNRFFVTTKQLTDADKKLREEFDALAKDVTDDMENYRIYLAAEKIYHYLWDHFASVILEESKPIFKNVADAAVHTSRQLVLLSILRDSLKLLHPFMPFITEEIWSSLHIGGSDKSHSMLILEQWPS